jgi:hypothetical protein
VEPNSSCTSFARATALERDQLPHDLVSLHVCVGYRVDREPYARRALIFREDRVSPAVGGFELEVRKCRFSQRRTFRHGRTEPCAEQACWRNPGAPSSRSFMSLMMTSQRTWLNSGPLSERMWPGTPRRMNRSESTSRRRSP